MPSAASLANLRPFPPGNRANPGGRPVAVRNQITTRFLRDLAEDFEEHGRAAIVECRETKPDRYLQVVAALLPKQLEIARPLDGFTDEELFGIVEHLRSRLVDGAVAEGIIVSTEPAPTLELQTLPQAV